MGWVVRCEIRASEAEATASRLWDLGTTGIAERAVGDRVELTAGFADQAAATAARRELDLYDPTVELDGQDWRGPTETIAVGDATLTIASDHAFGHGQHPTTALALEAVLTHVRPGHSMLDVGTGTGILAIAAATLGADPVVAVDIDPAAVATACANAARNDVTIDATTTPVAELNGSFDMVAANLPAADLEPIAHHLRSLAGDLVIVSGFLVDQTDRVLTAMAPLTPTNHADLDGWGRLELR